MVSLPTADSLQRHWEAQHSSAEETGKLEEVQVWWCGGREGEGMTLHELFTDVFQTLVFMLCTV